VKALENPEGALGECEELHFLGRQRVREGKEAEAVEAFLEENPDAVPSSS
jgi:hypothetical protein